MRGDSSQRCTDWLCSGMGERLVNTDNWLLDSLSQHCMAWIHCLNSPHQPLPFTQIWCSRVLITLNLRLVDLNTDNDLALSGWMNSFICLGGKMSGIGWSDGWGLAREGGLIISMIESLPAGQPAGSRVLLGIMGEVINVFIYNYTLPYFPHKNLSPTFYHLNA